MKDKPVAPPGQSSEQATSEVAEHDDAISVKIQEQAALEEIPLDQDAILTELLSDVPVENEIPENVYIAMAEIVTYLHGVEESLD